MDPAADIVLEDDELLCLRSALELFADEHAAFGPVDRGVPPARIEAATSSATAAFLGDLFRGADPTAAPTDTLSALDLLDRGARRLDGGLADQPAVRADLYAVIGPRHLASLANKRPFSGPPWKNLKPLY